MSEPTLEVGVNMSLLDEIGQIRIPRALRSLPEQLDFFPGLTLIVGENGAGKSTLLEAIALKLMENKGINGLDQLKERAPVRQQEELDLSFRYSNVLDVRPTGPFSFGHVDYTRSPVELVDGTWEEQIIAARYRRLSQRQSREAFAQQHLESVGSVSASESRILLIDEPEHGLDPWRHAEVATYIGGLAGEGATFIVATNSPVLLSAATLPRIDLRTPEVGVITPRA